MIAKIVKGQGFKGVVNYILDKAKNTELINSEGVRLKNQDSIIQSFAMQAEMNLRLSKPVCHISLDFSAQDKSKLNNGLMTEIANNYMKRMGINNTQFIIARHHDKEHPHLHIVLNRVDNEGKTISDRNDRFRSEKICKELTEKYGLYFAKGKENVKKHRLREPDKTKYEIYNILKDVIPNCKNWQELIAKLQHQDVKVAFKYKGKTEEVQGVIFSKNNLVFNGSKVDRQFSFSKINYQLKNNNYQSIIEAKQAFWQPNETQSTQNIFGGWLVNTPTQYNEDFTEQERAEIKRRKRKKRKGFRI